jgi:hypothetical protein
VKLLKGSAHDRVVREVSEFFRSHPEALADVEDIARWRLLQMTIARTVDETNDALLWLVERGELESIEIAGNQMYKLSPHPGAGDEPPEEETE